MSILFLMLVWCRELLFREHKTSRHLEAGLGHTNLAVRTGVLKSHDYTKIDEDLNDYFHTSTPSKGSNTRPSIDSSLLCTQPAFGRFPAHQNVCTDRKIFATRVSDRRFHSASFSFSSHSFTFPVLLKLVRPIRQWIKRTRTVRPARVRVRLTVT